MKWIKKPIVIEAVQYVGGGNVKDHKVPEWMFKAFESGILKATNGSDPLIVETLEGNYTVSPNDWIIQGIKGELYPCKPDIFEKTYSLLTAQKEPILSPKEMVYKHFADKVVFEFGGQMLPRGDKEINANDIIAAMIEYHQQFK